MTTKVPDSMTALASGAQGASEVLLGTVSASNQANVSFTSIPTGFDQYELRVSNAVPVTNGANLMLWASENNGTSYLNTGWQGETWSWNTANGSGVGANPGSGGLTIIGGASNAAGSGISGLVAVTNLGSGANYKHFWWQAMNGNGGVTGFGWYNTDQNAFNALQLYFSSGNISTGKFSLYGIRNS